VTIRVAVIICTVVPLLSGCGGVGSPSQVGQPTVQGQSMALMLADIDQIRGFVYGNGTQSEAENAANNLVSWSNRMAELFPPGQASVDYVDMSSERARKAPDAMSRTAGALLRVVRTGNRSAIGDQLAVTERDGCGFCHLSGSH
jgi:hypothetical protein